MNLNNQILCAWSAIVFIVLFLIGFGPFANFIPPTSPQTTAAEVANLYQQHNFALRTGALFTMASCTFIVPFAIRMSYLGHIAIF
jgi:hypothetical protein